MTPEEALQLLNDAASMAQLNRQAHVQVQQAVIILTEAIAPKEEEVEQPNRAERRRAKKEEKK